MTLWTELNGTPFSVRRIEIDGWSTRVLEAGTGSPFILMHGTGGHLETFIRNISTLSKNHRVIVYDYPGHGWTTLATADLEIDAYTRHLSALMDALGIERAHLSGESLGGWVAARFAAQHPERVDHLVLNTPGGTMATAEVMERIRSLSQAAADDPSDERIRTRLEWLMADPVSVTDEIVAVRKGVYTRPGFAESMRHILCLQTVDARRRNMLLPEELASISAPTMIIWTTNDPSGPPTAGSEMAAAIPNGRFELIENAGHWPQWEQKERFEELVRDFLGDE